jgi:hypothetical protein
MGVQDKRERLEMRVNEIVRMWRQKGKHITHDGFLYEEEKCLHHVIHPQVMFLECTCSNG